MNPLLQRYLPPVAAVVAVVAFVNLGLWQLDRAAQKEARQALFSEEIDYRPIGSIDEPVEFEGVQATVVMPDYAVPDKIAATKAYGATVEIVPTAELLETYERAREERGLTAVHPFDDPLIVAGAGTSALELLEDEKEQA